MCRPSQEVCYTRCNRNLYPFHLSLVFRAGRIQELGNTTRMKLPFQEEISTTTGVLCHMRLRGFAYADSKLMGTRLLSPRGIWIAF